MTAKSPRSAASPCAIASARRAYGVQPPAHGAIRGAAAGSFERALPEANVPSPAVLAGALQLGREDRGWRRVAGEYVRLRRMRDAADLKLVGYVRRFQLSGGNIAGPGSTRMGPARRDIAGVAFRQKSPAKKDAACASGGHARGKARPGSERGRGGPACIGVSPKEGRTIHLRVGTVLNGVPRSSHR